MVSLRLFSKKLAVLPNHINLNDIRCYYQNARGLNIEVEFFYSSVSHDENDGVLTAVINIYQYFSTNTNI